MRVQFSVPTIWLAFILIAMGMVPWIWAWWKLISWAQDLWTEWHFNRHGLQWLELSCGHDRPHTTKPVLLNTQAYCFTCRTWKFVMGTRQVKKAWKPWRRTDQEVASMEDRLSGAESQKGRFGI